MCIVAKKRDYEADRKPIHSAYQHQPRRVYPRFTRKPCPPFPLPCVPTNPFFPLPLSPASSPAPAPPHPHHQEFFWTFPDLEPLYNAARSYLEIGQRVELLNARVDVLQDMLKLLKESVNSSHGERLEAIVIFLMCVLFFLFYIVSPCCSPLTNDGYTMLLVELKSSSVSSPSLSISVSHRKHPPPPFPQRLGNSKRD